MKIEVNQPTTAYHKEFGPTNFAYGVDAHSAVRQHPKEWSFTPWAEDGKPSAPVVAIPLDWQDQTPSARINLALQISGEPRKGMTAAKADEIILAEVERREETPAPDEQPADQ